MPTRRADLRSLLLVLVLAAPALTACGKDQPPPPPERPRTVDALRGIARTLHQREAALEQADEQAFLRTIRREDLSFLGEQTTYFDNLTQLPVADLGYHLRRGTVSREGDAYWAEVTVSLRLEGYDDAPVTEPDRWRFTPDDRGRFRLSSTTDADWEADRVLRPQPWDRGPVQVRQQPGVLGVFDAGSVAHTGVVLDSVAAARSEVASALGTGSPPDVLVYVLTEPDLAATLPGAGLGADLDDLDAATVTVPAVASRPSGPVASYRIVLNPRVLGQSREILDRLVRHEVTHVALADRGDGAPLWLTEGIAEYVSVRPLAPGERTLPGAALALAEDAVASLPPDEVFAGPGAEAWYAVSWWICEYVAATYGDDMLWVLLDELDDAGNPEEVLASLLGVTPTQLAQRGIGLMQSTYAG